MSATSRALVIVHEPDGDSCQIEVRLRELGWDVDNHLVTDDYERPNQPAPWPDFADYDLIVPMGSIRSLTDKDEISNWIYAELEMLRNAHESGTPILGICFGGQLLAEALGGSVEKAPVTEIGWYEIEAANGADNPVGPGPWFEWHHDRFEVPPEAEVLAVNENAIQLFRIGKSVGTQFHPEVDVDHVAGFLAGSADEYLASVDIDRTQMLEEISYHQERNTKQCHALVDWFLDQSQPAARRMEPMK